MPKRKSNTPSFIVTRRILMNDGGQRFLDRKLGLLGRMYNNAVRHYRKVFAYLKQDVWYLECLAAWKASHDEDEKRTLANEIYECARWYGLTEYGIHAYLGKGKCLSNDKGINIDVLQKAGSELYASIKKALFAGTIIHFHKHGQTCSMSAKKPDSGIIHNAKTGTVKVMGRKFPLKRVRTGDIWMMDALTHKVKYCRIVRKA